MGSRIVLVATTPDATAFLINWRLFGRAGNQWSGSAKASVATAAAFDGCSPTICAKGRGRGSVFNLVVRVAAL